MLINSWLQSFRNRLQSRTRKSRRVNRAAKSRSASTRAENLEIRSLLTSPELVAISPNFGSFINDGDQLTEAPRELKFQFTPGQDLDINSLSGIQIVGSGFDDSFGEGNERPIAGGFVGFGDTTDQVIFRFAESLPDDRYLITIKGTGTTPLKNTINEVFNNGVDVSLEFDLDLGAQVKAVVPQPVIRDQILTINNVASLADGNRITINDGGSVVVFEFEDTAINNGTGGNPAILFNHTTDTTTSIATKVAAAINGALFSGPGVTATAVGSAVTIQGSVFTPTVTPTVGGAAATVTAGSATQLRDTVLVYFNSDTLNQTDAEDPRFYRLFDTKGTLTTTDDSVLLPDTITYDSTNNFAILKFAGNLPTATYTLKIGTSSEPDSTITTAANLGTQFATTGYHEGGYIGDNGNDDVDLYQVSLVSGSVLTVTVTPDANLNAAVRFFDANGNALTPPATVNAGGTGAVETFTFTAPADGIFFIGISSDGNIAYNAVDGTGNVNGTTVGSYVLDLAVTNPINGSDDNSGFVNATALGVLGDSGQVFTSQIEPQPIALPAYPSGSDEPGHREIPAEAHGAGAGTASTAPGPISTVQYYFPDLYGYTPQGQPRFNEITENQKQRAREIFELYSKLWGIEVQETASSGIPIITGDIRVFAPTYPLGVSLSVVLMDGSQNWGTSPYGGSWFNTALHEIGHAIGLGHSYDLPSVQGGALNAEDQYPGSEDIVHGLRILRPDATDIDLYQFQVDAPGTFSAEIVAQRKSTAGGFDNQLNSALRLYKEVTNSDGSKTRTLISQNDDYFGDDAFIEMDLAEPGTYYIGVSASGNTDYDPSILDSGFGGTSDGDYELRMNFHSSTATSLRDATGTAFDGDGDGTPGGDFVFSFRSDNTIFVDKSVATNLAAPATATATTLTVTDAKVFKEAVPFNVNIGSEVVRVTAVNTLTNRLTVVRAQAGSTAAAHPLRTALVPSSADGSLAKPFGLISNALNAADTLVKTLGQTPIVRILANGGADNNVATTADNRPYLVGLDSAFNAFEDGDKFEVPKNVLVQVDAGAIIKLQRAVIDAGSSAQGVDRSGGAVQVLGTPNQNVYLTSVRNDSLGGDSDGVTGNAQPGDWGGLVYRSDSDFIASDALTNTSDSPITLNYVNQARITYGGGLVQVDGADETFTPIHMVESRPTITNNTITLSAKGAISADPNSFSDDRGRIGPEIHGNTVTGNTTNALVIRSDNGAKLTATARLDDTDIVHVITDNLQIDGAPGGQIYVDSNGVADPTRLRTAGRLAVDAGVVVKLSSSRIEAERGSANLIAEGTPDNPVIFTSLLDDRYGAGGTFDTTGNLSTVQPSPGDWSGLVFNMTTHGSIDNAVIAYAGGTSPIAGGLSEFNAVEAHHYATLRVANSVLEFNATGNASDDRDSRGTNTSAVIFVRQAQPVIVNNVFTDNHGAIIDINANAMVSDVMRDPGRSTGPLDVGVPDGRDTLNPGVQFADNHGPLVRLNRFDRNDINGMVIRGGKLSIESVWDDTDIVHVLQDEITVDYHHTYSGLTLQSAVDESLVVKLRNQVDSNGNVIQEAGFTADGVRWILMTGSAEPFRFWGVLISR
ncbi:MAG: pre-peptidase C-terminal domain-containing protein [Planctomycetaceae bacterium]